MSSEEAKAKELIAKFYNEVKVMATAKACALICATEVMTECENHSDKNGINYWQSVKEHINQTK